MESRFLELHDWRMGNNHSSPLRYIWYSTCMTVCLDLHLDATEDLMTISENEFIVSSCCLSQMHPFLSDLVDGTIHHSVNQARVLSAKIDSTKWPVYSVDHSLHISLGMFISLLPYCSIQVQSITSFTCITTVATIYFASTGFTFTLIYFLQCRQKVLSN